MHLLPLPTVSFDHGIFSKSDHQRILPQIILADKSCQTSLCNTPTVVQTTDSNEKISAPTFTTQPWNPAKMQDF